MPERVGEKTTAEIARGSGFYDHAQYNEYQRELYRRIKLYEALRAAVDECHPSLPMSDGMVRMLKVFDRITWPSSTTTEG